MRSCPAPASTTRCRCAPERSASCRCGRAGGWQRAGRLPHTVAGCCSGSCTGAHRWFTARRGFPHFDCPAPAVLFLLQKLLAHAPLAVESPKFTRPHTKVNALLQVSRQPAVRAAVRGTGQEIAAVLRECGGGMCSPLFSHLCLQCLPRLPAVTPVALAPQPRHGRGPARRGGRRHPPAAGNGGRHLILGMAQPRPRRCAGGWLGRQQRQEELHGMQLHLACVVWSCCAGF